jgi:hypothetical protein
MRRIGLFALTNNVVSISLDVSCVTGESLWNARELTLQECKFVGNSEWELARFRNCTEIRSLGNGVAAAKVHFSDQIFRIRSLWVPRSVGSDRGFCETE